VIDVFIKFTIIYNVFIIFYFYFYYLIYIRHNIQIIIFKKLLQRVNRNPSKEKECGVGRWSKISFRSRKVMHIVVYACADESLRRVIISSIRHIFEMAAEIQQLFNLKTDIKP
jgi:hypothetical protein